MISVSVEFNKLRYFAQSSHFCKEQVHSLPSQHSLLLHLLILCGLKINADYVTERSRILLTLNCLQKPVGRGHGVLHTFYKNQFRKKLKRMMEGTLVKFRISKVTPSLSYAAELSRQHFPFPANTRVYRSHLILLYSDEMNRIE